MMASENCVVNVLDLFTRTKFGTKIDDFQKAVEAWCLVLLPLDDDVVMQAAVIVSRRDESNFVPNPGVVYQTALGIMDTEPSADEAWTHVLQYSHNASRPDADNPVKLTAREKKALELMGGNCGMWMVDEYQFRRKEFVEVYNRQEQQWRDQAALPAGQQWKQLAP